MDAPAPLLIFRSDLERSLHPRAQDLHIKLPSSVRLQQSLAILPVCLLLYRLNPVFYVLLKAMRSFTNR